MNLGGSAGCRSVKADCSLIKQRRLRNADYEKKSKKSLRNSSSPEAPAMGSPRSEYTYFDEPGKASNFGTRFKLLFKARLDSLVDGCVCLVLQIFSSVSRSPAKHSHLFTCCYCFMPMVVFTSPTDSQRYHISFSTELLR